MSSTRREFLKKMAIAGAGGALAAGCTAEPDEPETDTKKTTEPAKRTLGKAGLEVPCLSLGTNRLNSTVVLRCALQQGLPRLQRRLA